MRRGGIALVLAVLLGVAAPVSAGLGRGQVVAAAKDPKGDVKFVDPPGGPAPNKAPDIRKVEVLEGAVIRVRMRQSIKRLLCTEFSFAILVIVILPDGTRRAFLIEVHDKILTIGEVDPETLDPLPMSPPITFGAANTLRIELDESMPAGTIIDVQAFNTHKAGEDKAFDERGLSVDDPSNISPSDLPDLEPSIVGSLDQLDC